MTPGPWDYSSAALYVTHLATCQEWDWESKYRDSLGGLLAPEESLVLILPAWYEGLEAEGTPNSVRGKRTFGAVTREADCQAEFVWGYPCPFGDGRVQIDHLFPYSLGGPTVSENGVWLCAFHNRAKGAEFHTLDLGPTTSPWLPGQLERVASVRVSARRRGTLIR